MHLRTVLTAIAALALLELPACNALLERDVELVPEPCAMPLPRCAADSVPLSGDWDGDGRSTPALFDRGRWCITNLRTTVDVCLDFRWGTAGDTPLVGDWNGDGVDSPGWYRATRWSLKDANAEGDPADFGWGATTMQPLAGDWEARGHSTPGGARDIDGRIAWGLSNHNSGGGVDLSFTWGVPGPIPLVGDWNGDGTDTPALFQDGVWTFSEVNLAGGIVATFQWGGPGDIPLAGDWDGDGTDTVGLYRAGAWSLTDDTIRDLDGTQGPINFDTFRWGTE